MRTRNIFQKKSRKSGGPQYTKYLVITALTLVFLVIVVPYLLKGKKEAPKRPVPDKGTITKEVPKQPEQQPERLSELGRLPAPAKPAETRPPEPPAPEALKPPEFQPAPKPPEPSMAAPQKPPAAEAPPEGKSISPEKAPPAQAKSTEPAPRDLFPKKSAPPEAAPVPTVVKGSPAKPEAKVASAPPPVKPREKAGGPPPAAKPAPASEKGGYAVQVGASVKDRSQAEAILKNLAAKGYKAVIRPASEGSGYLVTTNPGPESKAYTLMEQMKIQGVSNTKVIKVGPSPEPAKKPAL